LMKWDKILQIFRLFKLLKKNYLKFLKEILDHDHIGIKVASFNLN